MNSHKNARLGFSGRVRLVAQVLEHGWGTQQAAVRSGVSVQTVRKWLRRYRALGREGLRDRSSRPHRCPRQLEAARVQALLALRARRRSGPQIADALGLPMSTVGDVLRRHGLGRLPPLTPRPPVVRYERERPGELLHIDAKRLGRIDGMGHRITGDAGRHPRRHPGWESLHVAIDDASRLAYAELLPDETARSAVVFLEHAVAWLGTLGVRVERVMTDNALCYIRARYAAALAQLGVRHVRIRPYTPRTNGKAERFIQTALHEWAWAAPYPTAADRAGALAPFIAAYNTTRPHTAHGRKPPISRLETAKQPLR